MASLQPINLTASTTLDDRHTQTLCTINAAAGLTLTLPAATGTGRTFNFLVGTTVTSGSVAIKVASASDTMAGLASLAQDAADTVVVFETAATSDTITLNGSTTGGIKGDTIMLRDAQNGLWQVQMAGSGTGIEATPFSATV